MLLVIKVVKGVNWSQIATSSRRMRSFEVANSDLKMDLSKNILSIRNYDYSSPKAR